MSTQVHMGAVELPAPPANVPENQLGPHWAICHSKVYAHPEPAGMKYKTHTIKEHDGKWCADIEYTLEGPDGFPAATPVETAFDTGAPASAAPAPAAPTTITPTVSAPVAPVPKAPNQPIPSAPATEKPKRARKKKEPKAPEPVLPPNLAWMQLAKPQHHSDAAGTVYWSFDAGSGNHGVVMADFKNQQESPIHFAPSRAEAVNAMIGARTAPVTPVESVPPTMPAAAQIAAPHEVASPSPQPIEPLALLPLETVPPVGATDAEIATGVPAEQVQAPSVDVEIVGEHAARTHHEYSMSKLNYIDDCSGFRSTDGTNEAAEEGTALHEVVEGILNAWLGYNAENEKPITLVQTLEMAKEAGLTMPDGSAMEDGQVDAVRDVLKKIDWEIPGATEIFIEEKLPLVHPDGTELNYGHIDLVIGFAEGNCTVMDYKFGRGQVREASRNYQGFGYAVSFLQAHAEYRKAKVVFVQPRISFESEHVVLRQDIPGIYFRIRMLIQDAENPVKKLKAGDQCRYCAMASKCPELANYMSRVGASYGDLPFPTTFHGSQITEPSQMALAVFWAKRCEAAVEGVKRAAVEMAKQGFDLTADLGPGGTVTFELRDRASPRVVGAAPLVYQQVKNLLSPEEFSACVDVRVGDLETIYADALQVRKELEGEKITKKAGVENLNALLTSEGLISRPEERISYLKEKRTPVGGKVAENDRIVNK